MTEPNAIILDHELEMSSENKCLASETRCSQIYSLLVSSCNDYFCYQLPRSASRCQFKKTMFNPYNPDTSLTTHAQSRKKATWFFRLLVRCLMGFNIYVINCFVATIFLHQPQRPLERFGIDTSIDQKWMQKIWLEVDIMEILVWICCFSPWLRSTLGQFFPHDYQQPGTFKVCYCASLDACNSLEFGVPRKIEWKKGWAFWEDSKEWWEMVSYLLCYVYIMLVFSSDIGHHPKSLSMYILHRVSMWALMWTLRCIWCSLVSSSIILYRYIMLAMLQCMQQTSCYWDISFTRGSDTFLLITLPHHHIIQRYVFSCTPVPLFMANVLLFTAVFALEMNN